MGVQTIYSREGKNTIKQRKHLWSFAWIGFKNRHREDTEITNCENRGFYCLILVVLWLSPKINIRLCIFTLHWRNKLSGDIVVETLCAEPCRIIPLRRKLWICSCLNGNRDMLINMSYLEASDVDTSVTLSLPPFDPLIFLAWANGITIWVIPWHLDCKWNWYLT